MACPQGAHVSISADLDDADLCCCTLLPWTVLGSMTYGTWTQALASGHPVLCASMVPALPRGRVTGLCRASLDHPLQPLRQQRAGLLFREGRFDSLCSGCACSSAWICR